MTIVDKIRELIVETAPQYDFNHEGVHHMNIKADKYARKDKFSYLEAVRTGSYETFNFRTVQVTQCYVYFCMFYDLDMETSSNTHDWDTREKLITQIEEEAVHRFVKALKAKYGNWIMSNELINFGYPTRSRFDANEVSVQINFRLAVPVC